MNSRTAQADRLPEPEGSEGHGDNHALDPAAQPSGEGSQGNIDSLRDATIGEHDADLEAARRAIGRADAAVLQSLLSEAFARPGYVEPIAEPDEEEAPEAEPAIDRVAEKAPMPKRGTVSKWINRLAKTFLGLAILVFAVWVPVQQLFQVASAEAVINAPVVTLRAPIGGVVTVGSLSVGDEVTSGDALLRIENPRVDLSAFNAAAKAVRESLDQRELLVAQIVSLEDQRVALEAQLEAFRQGRIALLTARLADPDLTTSQLMQTQIELEALERGVFIGDSYNDKPSSGQRLDAIAVDLSELEAQLEANLTRHPELVQAEAAERARLVSLSSAVVAAPADGSVWEVMVSPGEQVVEGQDLLRTLDCSRALVSAAVSESVYNRLTIGMAAAFTLREGGDPMFGEVVYLSGVSAAPSNLAIAPGALQAESYRVMLSVPALASADGCAVGHTGRVVFDSNR